MAHKVVPQLIHPLSIAVIGGSNNTQKPGGKLIKNIKEGTFLGSLYVVNPKEKEVQTIRSYPSVEELPPVDLAILAIPARFCPEAMRTLAVQKATRAFIIVSAGFSEESEEGKRLEQEVVSIVESVKGSLIGPNCIGILTQFFQGVFTLPVPRLSPDGCDFISGSGATAVFIMESGLPKGLTFSSVFSVGNSAHLGVEDVLEYLDESFDQETSSPNKLLYIESIKDSQKLLKHSVSLVQKGCKIAAIKAGSSEAGSRAASSHTGAMASSDKAVDALFRKAGITRCYSREQLSDVGGVFTHPELKGKNIAIITHAGGPAVMLTDELSRGGLNVPGISGPDADELLAQLYPGSSVANPIDILATGTAAQVALCIDYCENRFKTIDGIVIVFGSSGLFPVDEVYNVIDEKMKTISKPLFAVMPSISTAGREIADFREKGHVVFYDEVSLGNAISRVFNTPKPLVPTFTADEDKKHQAELILSDTPEGYLPEEKIHQLLDLAEIPRVKSFIFHSEDELLKQEAQLSYPLVMKVVGPIHKSDVGGVILNIKSKESLLESWQKMQSIKGFEAVLVQAMLSGTELFLGATAEENFGHMVFCGLGGIYVEAIGDVSQGLVPLAKEEALSMIRSLRSYSILEGIRGKEGVNIELYAEIIVRLSSLLEMAPQIKELDLNPLMANSSGIVAVDARIRI